MPANVKWGDPLGFLKLQFVAKYQKKLKGGTLWRHEKTLKNLTAEIIERGPSRFVRFRKCTKLLLAEPGTRTRDPWVPPKLNKVCTWYIHGKLCDLAKKLATNSQLK